MHKDFLITKFILLFFKIIYKSQIPSELPLQKSPQFLDKSRIYRVMSTSRTDP